MLRLFYAQTHGEIDGLQQELELLKNAPPEPPKPPSNDPRQGKKRQQEEDMWRLDAPRPMGGPDGKGPLLDSSGKARSQLEITSMRNTAYTDSSLAVEAFHHLAIERRRPCTLTGGSVPT